jgi:hypothetical protein
MVFPLQDVNSFLPAAGRFLSVVYNRINISIGCYNTNRGGSAFVSP